MDDNPHGMKSVRADERLLQEVNRLLGNPEHRFTDGAGEATVRQLKDAAGRCRGAGLGNLERSLEAAARRVEERTDW